MKEQVSENHNGSGVFDLRTGGSKHRTKNSDSVTVQTESLVCHGSGNVDTMQPGKKLGENGGAYAHVFKLFVIIKSVVVGLVLFS